MNGAFSNFFLYSAIAHSMGDIPTFLLRKRQSAQKGIFEDIAKLFTCWPFLVDATGHVSD